VLLIDNYDSFTFNLYQLIGSLAGEDSVTVVRNDAIDTAGVASLSPSHIVISPGPGKPADAGICEDVIRTFAGRIPILGVCLGHQAICEAFGATVTYAPHLMHGKASPVTLCGGGGAGTSSIFAGLPTMIQAGRYHSLAVDEATLPPNLTVTARADDNTVMAVEAGGEQVYGLQFHPESILTPDGGRIVENFLGIK
jgi:anthranilate synthase component 2